MNTKLLPLLLPLAMTGCASQDGIGSFLTSLVSLHGRVDASEGALCGSATIAGFGPEVCIGFATPQKEEIPAPAIPPQIIIEEVK